jgi:hypothetical protein
MKVKRVTFSTGHEATEVQYGAMRVGISIQGAERVSEKEQGELSHEQLHKLNRKMSKEGRQKRLKIKRERDTIPKKGE